MTSVRSKNVIPTLPEGEEAGELAGFMLGSLTKTKGGSLKKSRGQNPLGIK